MLIYFVLILSTYYFCFENRGLIYRSISRPANHPAAISPITLKKDAHSTASVPSTAVFPLTVTTMAIISINTFERNSSSSLVSFSGRSHLRANAMPDEAANTVAASPQAVRANGTPGKEKMAETRMLKRTGSMSRLGNHLRNLYAMTVLFFSLPVLSRWADKRQKDICMITSSVITTEISNISPVSDIHSEMWDRDCSIARGVHQSGEQGGNSGMKNN